MKIVLVEDNRGDALLIEEYLHGGFKNDHFDIVRIDRLSKAREYLKKGKADIILLDLGLPDSSGLDTFNRIYQSFPGIPIIVLSGLDDDKISLTAVSKGAQDYLVKGKISQELIVRAIKYAIERKKTEETIRKSEKRLKIAQALGRIGDWEYDIESNTFTWSEQTYKLFERDIESVPPSFNEEFTYFSPELRRILQDLGIRATESGESFESDIQVSLPSGKTGYYTGTIHPFREENGKITRLYGTVQDITERKQVEKELKESESKLLYAQRIANIGNWDWDLQSNELFWSGQNYHIFGLPEGMKPSVEAFLATVDPADLEYVKQSIEDALNGKKPYNIDMRIIKSDGTKCIVNSTAEVTFDAEGKPVRMFGTVQDVTERKCSQDALRESEAWYRLTFENVSDVIFRIDTDFRIRSLSPGVESLLGYKVEELINCSLQDLSLLTPDALQQSVKEAKRIMAGEQVRASIYELIAKDGTHKFAEISSSPLYQDDKIIGLISVARDITERKLAEEQRKKFNEELEQKVRERTAQFEEANRELEAFSYTVSHDLRAPVRAMNGFTGVLLEDYSGSLDAEGKRLLNVVAENAKKMGDLIDDLLTFSRLGRQDIRIVSIDMGRMVKSIYKELISDADSVKTEFRMLDLPRAHGDPSMMHQVWVNLIGNAIKFSSHRSKRIIEVGCHANPGENIYYIRDNGAGFDMTYHDKLFRVFQRLHSVRDFEGTGVGLAIVQRIINRFNGRVWAEGKVDVGAAFFFALPGSLKE